MTLTDFRARLRSEHHLFTDTLAFIAEHYSYTPSAFDNGSVSNPAGQNEGSCKTLGFAILEGLSLEETCWPSASTTVRCATTRKATTTPTSAPCNRPAWPACISSASPCRAGAEKSWSPHGG